MEYSTTDIDIMVKQANILGRVARGIGGAAKGSGKGMLIGGTLGALAAPFAGAGLAGALGVGGAGLFSGAMLGGAIRGSVGGLRGLLRSPVSKGIPKHIANKNMYRAGTSLPAIGIGAGAGYLVSDEDNKLMGSAIGAGVGLLARPAIVKALANRAAG